MKRRLFDFLVTMITCMSINLLHHFTGEKYDWLVYFMVVPMCVWNYIDGQNSVERFAKENSKP